MPETDILLQDCCVQQELHSFLTLWIPSHSHIYYKTVYNRQFLYWLLFRVYMLRPTSKDSIGCSTCIRHIPLRFSNWWSLYCAWDHSQWSCNSHKWHFGGMDYCSWAGSSDIPPHTPQMILQISIIHLVSSFFVQKHFKLQFHCFHLLGTGKDWNRNTCYSHTKEKPQTVWLYWDSGDKEDLQQWNRCSDIKHIRALQW